MMLFTLTVLLMSTCLSGASQPQVELGVVGALADTIRLSNHASRQAVQLLHNVFLQITGYQCSRGQDDCAAWQAVNMIEALELSKANCDEEKMNDMCAEARQFLEADSEQMISHEQIQGGLLAAAEGVSVQDYQYLNAIRDAVIDFICYKEPSKCRHIRYLATKLHLILNPLNKNHV